MPTFEVAQVMGSGSVQELICQVITLPSPAEEIKQIRKTVIIDNCFVVHDKVIVDGRLRKDILFKTAATGFPQPGTATACTGIVATIVGTLADVDVDIAFNALIPVPGARPGDTCVVLQAFVEGEKEEAANVAANGTFTSLIDKSIVFVCVKTNVSKTISWSYATNQARWTSLLGSPTSLKVALGAKRYNRYLAFQLRGLGVRWSQGPDAPALTSVPPP